MNNSIPNWKSNLQNQFDLMNIINILSFAITIMQMTEYDDELQIQDIKSENNKQSLFLISEIKGLFKEQNEMLADILDRLNKY